MRNEQTFKVWSGAQFWVLVVVALAHLVGAAVMFSMNLRLAAFATVGQSVALIALAFWFRGVMTIDDDGIELRRLGRVKRLAWHEIEADWTHRAGRWFVTLATPNDRLVVAGTTVERSGEVRQLLEARFPSR